MTATAYARLEERFKRIAALDDARGMLGWDQATMMPTGGAEARGEQIAAISAVRHGILTAPQTGDLLERAAAEVHLLDSWQAANLGEMKRRWRHATALDEDLVTALSRAGSACEAAWRTARASADFAAVLPQLDTLLGLVRQSAAAKAQALGLDPYDALLDQYEPGGRAADIEPVFAELAGFLPDFLGRATERQNSLPAPLPIPDKVPAERQYALCRHFMGIVGFDFDHGRLDVSSHPFSGGVPEDQRITTRYNEADPLSGFMAVLHESGHALYERGLPATWRGQPVGEARGMSLHESQSLLIEMQVARSRPFLAFAAPVIAEMLGGNGPAWAPDNLHAMVTRVAPGYIRVEADEVTYPAHVVLRFGLERAMVGGQLEARDLPGAWNDGFKKLMGLDVPNDRLGCLQDIHWYDGAFGYFPTYTLGAMTAAQIMDAARRADPAIDAGIAKGDLGPLMAWLRDNVHARASSLSTPELLRAVTGRPLEAKVFERHLTQRYLS